MRDGFRSTANPGQAEMHLLGRSEPENLHDNRLNVNFRADALPKIRRDQEILLQISSSDVQNHGQDAFNSTRKGVLEQM